MRDFSFARQPILDKTLQLYAYELLYRPINSDAALAQPSTAEVIISSIIDMGIDNTTNNRIAFINMTYEDIMSEQVEALPQDRVMLELLEDIKPDAALVARVTELINKGFSFALDDFVYAPEWDPLITLSNVIKFDLSVTSFEENKQLINQLKNQDIQFLAEKVETYQEYQDYLDIGCDYFQGYFFCKPEHIKGKTIDSSSLSKTKLIANINKPDASISDIDKIIEQDPGLTYQLLKYLNSSFFSFKNPIESIKQAIVILGLEGLKKWVTLICLRDMSSKPSEVMRVALTRAKLAEQIALKNNENNPSAYFLTGLLSNLDALLDNTMENSLSQMPLNADIKSALISHDGAIGNVLQNIILHESNDLPDKRPFDMEQYLSACQWADLALTPSSV
jgi:EAL and modified HD-GYP domain-containing signal transduction protein